MQSLNRAKAQCGNLEDWKLILSAQTFLNHPFFQEKWTKPLKNVHFEKGNLKRFNPKWFVASAEDLLILDHTR